MTDQQEPKEDQDPIPQTVRLTGPEFLAQLDTAADWMLWVNPAIEEVELIVKDSDERLTIFHGPEPMSMNYQLYKRFCAEVEALSLSKEA